MVTIEIKDVCEQLFHLLIHEDQGLFINNIHLKFYEIFHMKILNPCKAMQ